MSDVFVSYKSEDKRRVRPLVEALEADGYSVWWDEQIGGGAQWRHMIDAELNAAKCVIVVWSKRSVGPEGTFVQDEATRAQQRYVYVPVLIDKVHLPLGFGETQALPLTGWRGNPSDARYQAVLSAVTRLAGEAESPNSQPIAPTPVTRRAVVGGGAVAAAAIAGGGAWIFLKPGSPAASDSIAVLPFANLSGDPAQAYFSDGIAEELRSALARLAGLKVVGRTSSEAVRNDDAATAANKLGVSNILTGSVRQSPAVIRVSAQLVDGRNGFQRWSQNYDRLSGDAIKIQTDIAENVARALSIALAGANGAVLMAGGTENAEAHDLVLQADQVFNQLTAENIARAIRLVDEAIQLDPHFAGAYLRKAYLILLSIDFSTNGEDFARLSAEALEPAKKALNLAPNFAHAHAIMGQVYKKNFNIAAAFAASRRAVELGPGYPDLLRIYSNFVSRLGNQAESFETARRALELDPLNKASYDNWFVVLFYARRYEEADRFFEATKRKSPDLAIDPVRLGRCYVILGRLRAAQEQFSQVDADSWTRLTGEALIFSRSGDRAAAERKIQRLQEVMGDAASYQYGQIYADLGDKERAIAALEHAWAIRDAGLFDMRIDPFLDPVRGEPRFQAILKRMNFPA